MVGKGNSDGYGVHRIFIFQLVSTGGDGPRQGWPLEQIAERERAALSLYGKRASGIALKHWLHSNIVQ